jgi:hypothetical protein
MADKVAKPKKSKTKPKQDEKGVLAALPTTRPERIGTRRTGATVSAATTTAAASARTAPAKPAAKKPAAKKSKPAARAKPAAAKPARAKPATAKPAAATPSAVGTASGESSYPRAPIAAKRKPASSRPTAARRKAAAPRTFEPTEAAEAAAGAADERVAGITPGPRPRPVREGAPGMGRKAPDRGRTEAEAAESGRPSGVELVTTAVQAAGELTQIGLTIGGRIIKRAVGRLPKP